MYPGYFKNPVPPLCIVSTCVMYPRIQAKTPEICKIPGVLWPAIYGIKDYHKNLRDAEQFLAKYSASSTVQCSYNPKDPFQVLLNVVYTVKTWVAVAIAASFLIIILMYGTW